MEKLIKLEPDIRDLIIEFGGEDVTKCYQCGRCMPACPWNCLTNIEYVVYRYPQAIKLGDIISTEKKEDLEKETIDIFRCVGCDSCLSECPRGVNISDVLRAVRRILVDYGSYPNELKNVVSRLSSSGNPLGESAEKRSEWSESLGIPKYETGYDFLYNPCCIPAYDTRAKKIAQDTARMLMKANISFGVFGSKESCCGEAIRRVGAEDVFQNLARSNINSYNNANVKTVLTSSPHCHLVFSKEYPKFGARFKSIHMSQFLYQLVKDKKLVPKRSFNKKVVYHDPCTLGRQMGVYEEPRELLKSIPDLELVEIPIFNRAHSICCGGGSGGVWYDWPKDERLASFRMKQAIDTGAEVLAVACPYCLQMFEETAKSMGIELPVMDIAEILYQSL